MFHLIDVNSYWSYRKTFKRGNHIDRHSPEWWLPNLAFPQNMLIITNHVHPSWALFLFSSNTMFSERLCIMCTKYNLSLIICALSVLKSMYLFPWLFTILSFAFGVKFSPKFKNVSILFVLIPFSWGHFTLDRVHTIKSLSIISIINEACIWILFSILWLYWLSNVHQQYSFTLNFWPHLFPCRALICIDESWALFCLPVKLKNIMW